jgi:hypothetical protein
MKSLTIIQLRLPVRCKRKVRDALVVERVRRCGSGLRASGPSLHLLLLSKGHGSHILSQLLAFHVGMVFGFLLQVLGIEGP